MGEYYLTWSDFENARARKTTTTKHLTNKELKSKFFEEETWSGVPLE